MQEIHSLTMLVTRDNFVDTDERALPFITRLRGTFRDACNVDRIVFLDVDGSRTFIKNRYPAERLPEFTIIDHEFTRPTYMPYHSISEWCNKVANMRKDLRICK